jgi:hypothetical protein
MLNSRRWNQVQYEEEFNNPEARHFPQSKGACRMVSCPQKGDLVSFVCKGKIIMKGIVESEFETGTQHQLHSCNIGHRPHAIPTTFAWINITEIRLSEPIRNTGQRTWATMPV